jgi:hypothetical protein
MPATTTPVPSPTVTITITPGPTSATTGPITGNVTPTPTGVAGNVTERATSPGNLGLILIVVLGLLLLAFIAWSRWQEKK